MSDCADIPSDEVRNSIKTLKHDNKKVHLGWIKKQDSNPILAIRSSFQSLSVSFSSTSTAPPMHSSGLSTQARLVSTGCFPFNNLRYYFVTAAVDALFTGLGRDNDLSRKYPEFFRQISVSTFNRFWWISSEDGGKYIFQSKRDKIEPRSDRPVQESDVIPQTSEGRLLRDAIEICRDLRRSEVIYSLKSISLLDWSLIIQK